MTIATETTEHTEAIRRSACAQADSAWHEPAPTTLGSARDGLWAPARATRSRRPAAVEWLAAAARAITAFVATSVISVPSVANRRGLRGGSPRRRRKALGLFHRERCGSSPLVLLGAALASACGSPAYEAVSATPAGAFETSLTTFSDGMAVAWYDTRDGHPAIYERALDLGGTPVGPERRLTFGQTAAYEADVQSLSRDIAVGWYEKGPHGHLVPWLGAWSREGSRRWTQAIASSGRNTVVRAARGAIFAAWIQDEESDHAGVWGAWWHEDGTALIPPRRLADAGKTTWNLNAAIDPASTPGRLRAWVAFDAKAGTMSEELFLVDAGESSGPAIRLSPDDGAPSKYPDVAFSGDHAAVTWFDAKDGNEEVYLFVGTSQRLQQGGALPGRRVTSTSGHSIGAYLAWNGDRLGLAWCDDTVGQQEIYFQLFDSIGAPAGEVTRVTDTPASSLIPAIRPWRSGFALAWSEYEAPAGDGHGGDGRSQVVARLIP